MSHAVLRSSTICLSSQSQFHPHAPSQKPGVSASAGWWASQWPPAPPVSGSAPKLRGGKDYLNRWHDPSGKSQFIQRYSNFCPGQPQFLPGETQVYSWHPQFLPAKSFTFFPSSIPPPVQSQDPPSWSTARCGSPCCPPSPRWSPSAPPTAVPSPANGSRGHRWWIPGRWRCAPRCAPGAPIGGPGNGWTEWIFYKSDRNSRDVVGNDWFFFIK